MSNTTTTTNTVRVRIFVSVTDGASWLAYGCPYLEDEKVIGQTEHYKNDAGYWIEAELPLPNSSPTLTATITRA